MPLGQARAVLHDVQDEAAFKKMLVLGSGLKSIANTRIMENDGTASKYIKTKVSGYMEV